MSARTSLKDVVVIEDMVAKVQNHYVKIKEKLLTSNKKRTGSFIEKSTITEYKLNVNESEEV